MLWFGFLESGGGLKRMTEPLQDQIARGFDGARGAGGKMNMN